MCNKIKCAIQYTVDLINNNNINSFNSLAHKSHLFMNQTTLVTYKLFWFTKIHFSKESFVSESYNTGSTVPLYVFIYQK